MPTLTIAIPTYNRREAVAARLSEYLAAVTSPGVELLVSDNCSPDGTFAELAAMIAETDSKNPVRLVANSTNLGFHGNFAAVIEKSQNDYVLIMSDEDRLDYDKLGDLTRFLDQHSPALASPQAVVNGRIYRGSSASARIDAASLRGSVNYVAGLVFHRERSLQSLTLIKPLFDVNSMAAIYPQVLLADSLFCAHPCWSYGEVLVTKAVNLQSYIVDNITSKSARYYHLASRWEQLKGELSFLRQLRSSGSPDVDRARVDLLIEAVQSRVFHTIRFGLEKEAPDLAGRFLDGARSLSQKKVDELTQRVERLEEERDALENAVAALVEKLGAMERLLHSQQADGRSFAPSPIGPR